MLSQKSFQKISALNPERFYLENVRSIFGITTFEARLLCEMAVEQKLFQKRIALICPDPECHGRIIATFRTLAEIPETISCSLCEAEDHEQISYNTSSLKKISFYNLVKS